MHTLSATTTAATAVQNPSVSEPHVVKVSHSKKEPATEDKVKAVQVIVSANPVTAVEQHHHTLRRTAQPRMLNAKSCGRTDIFKVAASLRRRERTWKN